MNVTNTVRAAGAGLLFGALAGLLSSELGILGCLPGNVSTASATAVLGGIGAVAGRLGRSEIVAVCTAILLSVYALVAATPLAAMAAHGWVRSDVIDRSSPPLEAVISLSSSVLSNGEIDSHALDRLLTAVELTRTQPAARLLTTRIRARRGGAVATSDASQREIVRLAGLDDRWSVVDSVFTTRDEAVRARQMFPPGARPPIAVVTSPMHTRRACAAFEAVGFTVRCVAAAEHSAVTRDPVSSHDRLAAFREYLYERLGWIKYRASGWVGYSSR